MFSNVAIFVDGDNVACSNADKIKALGASAGQIQLAKVYGNQQALSNWAACPDFHFVYSGSGKNASDLLLTIEATEFTLLQNIQTVVIATSDSDFSHLARHLRERGIVAIGCGSDKAKPKLRSAFSKFSVLQATQTKPKDSGNAAVEKKISTLDLRIKDVIAEHSIAGKGMRLADMAPIVSRLTGTKISQRPERTWRNYLAQRNTLFAMDPRGPEAKVRYLPDGF